MNEFIVWDAKEKVFPNDTYRFVRDTSGHLYVRTKSAILEHQNVENRYFAFDDIGKTDINSKKIYAESSIVEFDFKDNVFSYKEKGCFLYDNEFCCYALIGLDGHKYLLSNKHITNFKIIDTIQENKLGLYNKDK